MQVSLNVTPEYKYYIMFCGVFAKTRNVVKHWTKYEKAFLKMVASEKPGLGEKHLFQAIVLYFMRFDPTQQKYLSTFFKHLYDSNVFSDTFLSQWHSAKAKLDKKCALYDKKAERLLRPLLNDFVSWLTSEYDPEAEYGEEEEKEEAADENALNSVDDETRR